MSEETFNARHNGTSYIFETEVLKSFVYDECRFVIHKGHNSLLNTLVVSEYRSGCPFKIYNLKPSDEVNDELVERYIEDFMKPDTTKLSYKKLPEPVNGVEDETGEEL